MSLLHFTRDPSEVATSVLPQTLAFVVRRGAGRAALFDVDRFLMLEAFNEPLPLPFRNDRGEPIERVAEISDPRVSQASRDAVAAWQARRVADARASSGFFARVLSDVSYRTRSAKKGAFHAYLARGNELARADACPSGHRHATVNPLDSPVIAPRAGDLLGVWVNDEWRLACVDVP